MTPTGPTPTAAASGNGSLNSVAGQVVSIAPNSLVFTVCQSIDPPKSVMASTNFEGTISATAGPGCSVSPASQDAVVTPGSGGAKTATFTVGASSSVLACTVTFTDKKGNNATLPVQVVFSGDGTCFI